MTTIPDQFFPIRRNNRNFRLPIGDFKYYELS